VNDDLGRNGGKVTENRQILQGKGRIFLSYPLISRGGEEGARFTAEKVGLRAVEPAGGRSAKKKRAK